MRNAFVMALVLVAAGCGRQEEVRRYKAPKDPSWRILGAVSAAGGATWFFKLAAPADRIDGVRDGVVAFYKSFRTEDGRLKWTTPAGWTEEKGNANREATLLLGAPEPKLEISVTRFQGDGGGMLANLNRWREQLGLEKVGEADLAAQVQKVEGAAIEVFLIDLTGPSRPSGGPRGMARQAEAPPPSANRAPGLDDIRALFTFERPPSWKENSQPSSGRIFEFMVDEGGGSALVSLSALQGGGDLASNVNRWRGQAGLDPLPEADIPKVAAPMSFVGNEAWLVEAIGKERGIVVVASLSPQFSIFLKMDGAPSTVQSQKATFMRVAQTFQMKGRHE
ncbi:MAG TPA: hypothetical protein VM222_07455 [Planctomycetota bacterium]|nr:hypothetical protein [Planctomycetota bacterium]